MHRARRRADVMVETHGHSGKCDQDHRDQSGCDRANEAGQEVVKVGLHAYFLVVRVCTSRGWAPKLMPA